MKDSLERLAGPPESMQKTVSEFSIATPFSATFYHTYCAESRAAALHIRQFYTNSQHLVKPRGARPSIENKRIYPKRLKTSW
jgi:hypothetical protein